MLFSPATKKYRSLYELVDAIDRFAKDTSLDATEPSQSEAKDDSHVSDKHSQQTFPDFLKSKECQVGRGRNAELSFSRRTQKVRKENKKSHT
jgi:hypothetical protein